MSRAVQQNVLQTQPDGTVGAVFPGGVDLVANAKANPDPVSTVDWLRQSDGALVARVRAITTNTGPHGDTLFLEAGQEPASTSSSVQMNVVSSSTGGANQLSLSGDKLGGSRLDLAIAGFTKRIIDESGRSNWPQFGAAIRSLIVGGGVTAAGNLNYGHGFVVGRLGVGTYQLVYLTSFPVNPIMLIGSDQGGPIEAWWTGNSLTGPVIHTTVGGVAADVFWSFLAVGLNW